MLFHIFIIVNHKKKLKCHNILPITGFKDPITITLCSSVLSVSASGLRIIQEQIISNDLLKIF